MEAEVIKLAGQLGGAGLVMFIIVKYGVKFAVGAIERMYTDMKKQQREQLESSSKREEILMALVEENTEANTKISMTLQSLCNSLMRKGD